MSKRHLVHSLVAVVSMVLVTSESMVPARASEQAAEKTQLEGLTQPVEIITDRWGIAHIYAKTENDLFFAQGYNAARDRLFQFEVWRRQATGTTAEILGKRALKRDIGTRLHMFRRDLRQELNHYHPRGEAIVNAYVRGVNAYIGETEKNPKLLPLEFTLLGIKPGKWTPEVVISRHQGLLGNITRELPMAQAVRVLGAERVKSLMYFQGGDPKLEVDPAIDLSLITDDILELYDAFRDTLDFVPEDIAAVYRATRKVASLQVPWTSPSEIDLSPWRSDIGSNNWTVGGGLTQSGYPIVANDPHRTQSAPSLRYWVHLVGPGWNVMGGGEPVLPGVSIGHNEYAAWGLTIYGTDGEDLYVYDANPANQNQYRYLGGWEDMKVIKDTIAVKGEAPVSVDLKYTRHGPVLHEDTAHHKAYALKAAWMEIGAAPYLASLRMNQARTWDEFREACRYSRIPAENMVWADVRGNIGWQAVAIAPIRPNWSGLVPVPGDGRYEWDGYLPISALPHVFNPAKGYYVTANHFVVPPDYPYEEGRHFTWADPFRGSRVTELIRSGRLFTVADMVELQNDDFSIPARSLVPLLRDVPMSDQRVAQARDTLLKWNYVLDRDSVAAGVYEMWQRRLQVNVRDLLVPAEARPFIGMLSMKKIIDWLYAPDGRFGEDPIAGRNAVLAKSLEQAVADLTKRLGPDMNGWQYGKYHYALIPHPLADVVNDETRARLNVGPVPRGGDGFTVTATGSSDNQRSGGSLKIIMDTEDWDNSVGLNNPGQSGDPDNPHYRDLFQLWSQGKYFPLCHTEEKVKSVAERSFVLEPR